MTVRSGTQCETKCRAPPPLVYIFKTVVQFFNSLSSLLSLFDILLHFFSLFHETLGLSLNDSTAILTFYLIDVATLLNESLELLVTIGDVFEELGVELGKHGGLLLGDLVLVRLLLGWLRVLLGLTFGSIQLLLSLGLTVEDSAHDLLLSWVKGMIIEGSAHAHHRDGTVAVTDGGHRAVDLERGEDSIRDLLRVGDLILSVEEVPNIEETIHTGEEEETWAGRRPATISKVGGVIACLHDWVNLEIFTPNLGGPITDSEEVLEVTRVSLNVVDRSVVLSLFKTELVIDFDLLSLVGLKDVTLLSTDEVLKRRGIGIVFKRGTTEDLGYSLSIDLEVLDELELLSRTSLKVSLIPPKKATISGGGDTLGAGLTSNPIDIIDWVCMGLLKDRGESRSD